MVIVNLFLGYLQNRFFWVKLWLLLRIFKFEVVFSYIIMIKLTRTVFLSEKFHKSYWLMWYFWGKCVFFSLVANCIVTDTISPMKWFYFPISYLSRLDYCSYVDILFVIDKLILKMFPDSIEPIEILHYAYLNVRIFLLIFRLKLWCCVTIGN